MLAQEWEGLHDHHWSVAQVNAPFVNVTNELQKMRAIRNGGDRICDHSYTVANTEACCLFVVYSLPDSEWTYLESVLGFLDGRIPPKLSQKLKTDVLHCGFEDNCGLSNYECFRNGRIIESCGTGYSDFFDPQSDCFDSRASDGKEKQWTVNSTMTLRYFSKLPSELDIESAKFNDYWWDVSEKLGVNIPYLNWALTGDSPLKFGPESNAELIKNSILLESNW